MGNLGTAIAVNTSFMKTGCVHHSDTDGWAIRNAEDTQTSSKKVLLVSVKSRCTKLMF